MNPLDGMTYTEQLRATFLWGMEMQARLQRTEASLEKWVASAQALKVENLLYKNALRERVK